MKCHVIAAPGRGVGAADEIALAGGLEADGIGLPVGAWQGCRGLHDGTRDGAVQYESTAIRREDQRVVAQGEGGLGGGIAGAGLRGEGAGEDVGARRGAGAQQGEEEQDFSHERGFIKNFARWWIFVVAQVTQL